jgi:DcuC family C4-dicarboxylate transporter
MVAPICAAMGFAMAMTATGCDRHLVHMLMRPVRRARGLVLPVGIAAAYLVNMAISSQTSTAAALGPILVPLLLAGGYSRAVAGGALLLGASFGGDLLNPGAQDVQAIAGVTGLPAAALSGRIIPAGVTGVAVAIAIFTLLNWKGKCIDEGEGEFVRDGFKGRQEGLPHHGEGAGIPEAFRINVLRAVIPLVPVALLMLGCAGAPWLGWLVAVPEAPEWRPLANALPVVRAMLVGAALAAVVCWRDVSRLTRSFFEGTGTAYGGIISLTITAQCFGAGIAAVGMGAALLDLANRTGSLRVLAAGFPWALAILSGSGSGPILVFAETFLKGMPAAEEGTTRLAALACFGGAAGRTLSPVAAVVIYASGLVGVSPVAVIKKVGVAVVVGILVAMGVAGR